MSWIKLLNRCLLAQICPLDSDVEAGTLHVRCLLSLLSTRQSEIRRQDERRGWRPPTCLQRWSASP